VIHVDRSIDALGPHARTAIERAFAGWFAAADRLPRVRFEFREGAPFSADPDGINSLSFGPIDLPGHENDLAITLSHRNVATGEILEADVIVSSTKPWAELVGPVDAAAPPRVALPVDVSPSARGGPGRTLDSASPGASDAPDTECNGRFDLQSVLTHEVGHFFGLGEDTERSGATMFATTWPCRTDKRSLAPSDVAAIASAYSNLATDRGAGRCSVGVGPTGNLGTPCSGLVLAGLLWAAAARRRRCSVTG
jgi:hypothetical protein